MPPITSSLAASISFAAEAKMASAAITTNTIGFPRIGPNREMKKALER